ncbi:predicted protein [Sclerotinia sclerotiorum 1980 UF-70]|uniref:Uncharacterized protein n=1 Tax=Sclerotinia sclerotiorum (strain ATCC 18683 / 1980 / Ss-1) TaxID=665079 RepID=A7EXV5_SCLS1|nr:predicted protein [Sclerotinia sclerotiorum 1980 UF-70]EDN94297.1 predicted protein [Sclerotinia sclerotiorum 1980 UF-70]
MREILQDWINIFPMMMTTNAPNRDTTTSPEDMHTCQPLTSNRQGDMPLPKKISSYRDFPNVLCIHLHSFFPHQLFDIHPRRPISVLRQHVRDN